MLLVYLDAELRRSRYYFKILHVTLVMVSSVGVL